MPVFIIAADNRYYVFLQLCCKSPEIKRQLHQLIILMQLSMSRRGACRAASRACFDCRSSEHEALRQTFNFTLAPIISGCSLNGWAAARFTSHRLSPGTVNGLPCRSMTAIG